MILNLFKFYDMKHLFGLLMIVAFSCTVACAQSPFDKEGLSDSQMRDANIDREEQLRLDVGEMLMVGFRGQELNEDNHIVRDILKYNVGGVILFEYDAQLGKHGRNVVSPNQLKRLCGDLQQLREETLLIGIDQEGGLVCRMKTKAGFDRVISAEKMGKGGLDTVSKYARITAKMLNEAGVNLNFAPCVDVNVNPNCPVIGKLGRSFSENPEIVGECALKWVETLNEWGIISCIKHFPGHGSSSKDSHHGLVDVTNSWKDSELEPYRMLAKKVDMVMTTHVINGQIDADYPATLSRTTIDMLRKDIGFEGVVVTDDMAMKAITNQYGYEDAIKLAIEAGVDMLCLGNNGAEYNPEIVPETVNIIMELVKNGVVESEQIHASAERIRHLKAKLGKR